jgi:tellurite resistance protein
LLLNTPLWRQTPPAIFPVCLGFMSLALGWRNASDALPLIPQDIGSLMLGLSTGFFIWFLMFYLRKLAARPMVLFEDMRTAPARAGIAAMAMSMMILAAALLPLSISVPQVWWTGVVMQISASAIVLHAIWRDPPEARHFTTFQYLTFVGPVVGPIAGIPLGYVWESYWLTMAALVAYVIVTAGITMTFSRKAVAGPLRPSMIIFLAPVCLFILSYGGLGYEWAFTLFYWLGNIIAFVLLLLVPWMMRGGYTPVWASFTFPTAAFINVQVMAVSKGHGIWAIFGVYAGLAIGTPLIVYIAYRSIMAWVTGELARKSGAAIA